MRDACANLVVNVVAAAGVAVADVDAASEYVVVCIRTALGRRSRKDHEDLGHSNQCAGMGSVYQHLIVDPKVM